MKKTGDVVLVKNNEKGTIEMGRVDRHYRKNRMSFYDVSLERGVFLNGIVESCDNYHNYAFSILPQNMSSLSKL